MERHGEFSVFNHDTMAHTLYAVQIKFKNNYCLRRHTKWFL